MEALGALEVARIPSVNVLVCAVKGVSAPPCATETPRVPETPCASGVVTSVPGCVLPSTLCMSEQPSVNETASVSNMVCVRDTAGECPRVCEWYGV